MRTRLIKESVRHGLGNLIGINSSYREGVFWIGLQGISINLIFGRVDVTQLDVVKPQTVAL